MSSNYTCYAAADKEIKASLDQKAVMMLKRLALVTGICLAGGFIWIFIVSPCRPLNIAVTGFSGFNGQQVLTFARIQEGASYFSLDASAVAEQLSSHYLVESARVDKRFPDRLSIFIQPRQAVALTLSVVEGRQVPLYLDREGVVFRIGNEGIAAPAEGLPVISGLVVNQPFLGMRLPVLFEPLFSELGKIKDEAPGLLKALSEIQIMRRAYGGYDILLYPTYIPVRVRLGDNFNADTLGYVVLILDVLKPVRPLPEEVDFRTGVGAYTVKEARFDE
ncbi:MAG: FtsQ-type POTRA domain-containing protein [Treponema sp.]|jgi:cell division protein FtsQ|nr:FtsQ-type POTRA domain-containing protein [Treponema sp.]